MVDAFTPTEAIEFAVATEEMGVRTYSKLATKFADNQEIHDAFSLLAKDENAHKAQFQALLGQLPPDDSVMTGEEKSRYLQAMAMSEFFRGDAGLLGKLDQVDDLTTVLAQVLGFEKATLGYYLAMKDLLGEVAALDSVIEAEKGHIVRLMKYVLTDEKMKGLGDSF